MHLKKFLTFNKTLAPLDNLYFYAIISAVTPYLKPTFWPSRRTGFFMHKRFTYAKYSKNPPNASLSPPPARCSLHPKPSQWYIVYG
jgi:hypothetical protein